VSEVKVRFLDIGESVEHHCLICILMSHIFSIIFFSYVYVILQFLPKYRFIFIKECHSYHYSITTMDVWIIVIYLLNLKSKSDSFQGRVQDFKLEGAHLKKLRRAPISRKRTFTSHLRSLKKGPPHMALEVLTFGQKQNCSGVKSVNEIQNISKDMILFL
jgi:hypothetical protein